jgi:hypothetical protein
MDSAISSHTSAATLSPTVFFRRLDRRHFGKHLTKGIPTC